MLIFVFQYSVEIMKFWLYEFIFYVCFKLGKICEIELEVYGEFEIIFVLYSYFNVGDIVVVKVSGFGECYIDKVNNVEEGVLSNGVQIFFDCIDCVYFNVDSCSVIYDDVLNCIIDVVYYYQYNVVVWNLGLVLFVSMGDMLDDGYKIFVCVEICCVIQLQKVSEEMFFCLV